jgi:lactoylglutathione lyase
MKYTHITIHVSNLEKSLAFYHELLGLPIVRRFPAGAFDIAFVGEGAAQIELIPSGKPDAGYNGFSIGFTVDSLEESSKKLEAAGYAKVQGPVSPNPHVIFSFFHDPDGVEVELVENR